MPQANDSKSLRLVLNAIATAAARYGRAITPLLSLSIDFYVRLFVQIKTSPIEVKNLSRSARFVSSPIKLCIACRLTSYGSQTAVYYICTVCQSYCEQPLGRTVQGPSKKRSSEPNLTYKSHAAPTAPQRCPECDSTLHVCHESPHKTTLIFLIVGRSYVVCDIS